MVRQFVCSHSGELCSRPDCKIGYCAVEAVEARAAEAKKASALWDLPTWRGTIRTGRRYTLRNGAIVIITGREPLRWISADGKKSSVDVWIGNYLRTSSKITWQIDGWHAPECGVRPHELDIVSTAP